MRNLIFSHFSSLNCNYPCILIQILVQLCDKFIHIMQLKCLKLVISCVGSRNNSDSQESSDTNMSTDMNVYIVNFCSLGNAIKTILKSLGTLASRTTPTIRSLPTPTCRTTRTSNVYIVYFCSLGNAYKIFLGNGNRYNSDYDMSTETNKCSQNIARFARTHYLVSYAIFFKKQQEFLTVSNPAVPI